MMCGDFRRLSANKAITEEAEGAKLLPPENELPKRPHHGRETTESPPLSSMGKSMRGTIQGGVRWIKRELSGAGGDLRNKLDGACTSADDGYVLAVQVDAVIPSGRVKLGARKTLQARQFGYCGTCKAPMPELSTLARTRIPSPAAACHTLSA
jgi:hypothetical protein